MHQTTVLIVFGLICSNPTAQRATQSSFDGLLKQIATADAKSALRSFRTAFANRQRYGLADGDRQLRLARATAARATSAHGRRMFIQAVQARSLTSCAPAIEPFLKDDEPDVVRAAVTALTRMKLTDYAAKITALTAHSDRRVRGTTAWAIAELGTRTHTDVIARLLDDPDAWVRGQAASSLGRLVERRLTKRIAALLEDRSPVPQGHAAVALARLGARDHAPAIAKLLTSTDRDARWRAARALGELGATKHIDEIADLLDHEDAWSRGFAAYALGLLGASEHGKRIAALTNDPNSWVRVYAIQALDKLRLRQHAALLEKRLDDMANCSLLRYEDPKKLAFQPVVVGEVALGVLRRWNIDLASATKTIAAKLDSDRAGDRAHAIEALVMLEAEPHLGRIAKLVKDSAWPVRRDAIWALAVLGAKRHATIVAERLSDPQPTVQAQAIWALGVLRATDHREAVRARLDHRGVAFGVNVSTSPKPSDMVASQTRLGDFAAKALARMDAPR